MHSKAQLLDLPNFRNYKRSFGKVQVALIGSIEEKVYFDSDEESTNKRFGTGDKVIKDGEEETVV